MLCCNSNSINEYSRTPVDVSILSNHINLCLVFLVLFLFSISYYSSLLCTDKDIHFSAFKSLHFSYIYIYIYIYTPLNFKPFMTNMLLKQISKLIIRKSLPNRRGFFCLLAVYLFLYVLAMPAILDLSLNYCY
jgi:hypothetical protein